MTFNFDPKSNNFGTGALLKLYCLAWCVSDIIESDICLQMIVFKWQKKQCDKFGKVSICKNQYEMKQLNFKTSPIHIFRWFS